MADDNPNNTSIDRRRLLQGLGGAGAVALAGCTGGDGGDGSGGTGTPGGNGGGKLNFAQVKSPIEFDPIVLNDVPSGEIAGKIFEGLYEYNDGIKLVPKLAEGKPQPSEDQTSWTVTLKEGPKFHNGDPVTPEDVKYTYLAPVKEETENASEFNMIESISIDGQDVTFNLSYPYAAFKYNLTLGIVPKSVREEDKKAFNTKDPVGSGAFQFDGWEEGNFVRIKRWEDYWGEKSPNLAQIEFTPVTEGTTRVTTLRNGDNHIVKEIPPKQWSTVEGMSWSSINAVPGIGYFYLAFNCANGPTTDPKVREAIDYCFSMDQAVSNFVEPTGIRQFAPTPASVTEEWGFPIDEWKSIPHDKDVDKASQMFEEAGVSKDYSWKIIVPPDDKREQIGVTVSNGLKEAGFSNVSVQRLDWGAFLDAYVSKSADDKNMYTLGWAGVPDPDAFTYYMFAPAKDVTGVTDGTFYSQSSEKAKQATQKFVTARESADRAERKRLYTEGITTVLEDRAHIPAYNLKNSFGVANAVKDFSAIPTTEAFHIFSNHNNVSIQ